ncbi:MAG TPA: double-cubane-cluster-containing anaerobic reductase, partial [Syntrophorhabdaceae bacterium]|nr:double-cubane-cluster-containing anaerobic reductase [Syntrophorhabdaceae bacterium]
EVIRSLDLVPATLCAFSNKPIEEAEVILPANLCPLIKSSFGFIKTDTCPFFGLSDVVIGETTCDGKKKMFELISHYKPIHVMDLPQLPDEPEAQDHWENMIYKVKQFLEKKFHRTVNDERIEEEIKKTNKLTKKMNEVFDYIAIETPAIGWEELYDIFFLSSGADWNEIVRLIDDVLMKLEKRKKSRFCYTKEDATRVMVTGCPIAGDATKVFKIIEELGGVIVALEACSGMKPYMSLIEEDTGNPVRAIARHYLKIPCSCMTPNFRRLEWIDTLIERFRPQAMVDVILQACHSYNIESYKVGEHIRKKHGLPFLKIETDYSQSDIGQIKTRVGALLELCRANA